MSDIATDVQPDILAIANETAQSDVAEPAGVEAGQGEGSTTSGLYSLDSIPESIREQVEPHFKEWDAAVTREFQKRAEALNGWKPYDELGIRDIPVEDMQHLKTFYELASDEEQFAEWVREAAESLGILEGAAPASPAAASEEGGESAPAGYMTPEQVEQLLEERLTAREQEREREAQEAESRDTIAREVRTTLDELKADFANDGRWDEDLVAFYAQRHMAPGKAVGEALQAGYADFQRLLNATASDALDEKVAGPKSTAVTGGNPNSAPKPATSFEEAKARTLERLRAENAQ